MSAFGDWRPMRPKPLMPTRAMVVIPPVAATGHLDAYVIGAPWDRLCADRLGHRGGLGCRGGPRGPPRRRPGRRGEPRPLAEGKRRSGGRFGPLGGHIIGPRPILSTASHPFHDLVGR